MTSFDDPYDKQISTVGKPHPHLEIKIIDPSSGKILPKNAQGEICIRGYSVMEKYWGDEKVRFLLLILKF